MPTRALMVWVREMRQQRGRQAQPMAFMAIVGSHLEKSAEVNGSTSEEYLVFCRTTKTHFTYLNGLK